MIDQIKLEDVVSVYSGKPYTCRCGCAGTYHYASAHQEYSSNDRGYEVEDDELNDKMVKRIVKYINEHFIEADSIDDYIFTIEKSETRVYTAYLKDPSRQENGKSVEKEVEKSDPNSGSITYSTL